MATDIDPRRLEDARQWLARKAAQGVQGVRPSSLSHDLSFGEKEAAAILLVLADQGLLRFTAAVRCPACSQDISLKVQRLADLPHALDDVGRRGCPECGRTLQSEMEVSLTFFFTAAGRAIADGSTTADPPNSNPDSSSERRYSRQEVEWIIGLAKRTGSTTITGDNATVVATGGNFQGQFGGNLGGVVGRDQAAGEADVYSAVATPHKSTPWYKSPVFLAAIVTAVGAIIVGVIGLF